MNMKLSDVAMCDLVHDLVTIHGLSKLLTAS